ncbi:signal transduction histidine kinase [Schinkia azotoformans MEV2011]|uniref:histidine kinase n=1 Tax=Schinkia azotoformans MEV2011 TaxID=1348973 RepID=A0A072NRW8_SCHAZ|nr:HAMP domain-containing sensor histidine kinase [Schinkia azotoformans]KEF40201.1 signal transduction histidine kinase [Schinkia azotoformans MEV2011]MEC1694827.1 HAMP domain-containing sensor histidine kinase [Schinkia azotoformans]MEC1726510.1 HAMP domain-containing sensor histidine kinase [Schinkia azotoformans]MEC1756851.1 HAMP domain-containing sensor histidine kinase [Schinkia azotoformans]MEC1773132.1 HAMP domain-containing sensor histidine kinase [Schinkia azotoformans]
MTLKAKLHILIFTWTIIILLVGNLAVYLLFVEMIKDKKENSLEYIASTIENQGIPKSDADEAVIQKLLPEDSLVRIIAPTNEIKFEYTNESDYSKIPASFSPQAEYTYDSYDGDDVIVFVRPILAAGDVTASIQVISDFEDEREDIQDLLYVLLTVSGILLVISILLSFLASSLFLRPLAQFIKTMEDIRISRNFKRISINDKNSKEMNQVAQTFNAMIEQLEEQFEKQEQFVSNASHELRTPLTIIESYASLLKRWGREDEEVLKESIDAIHQEALGLKAMIKQLLELARYEEQMTLPLSDLNAVDIGKKTINRLKGFTNRPIHLLVKEDSIPVFANEQALIQVLTILADNALKYSEDKVEIKIDKDKNKTTLQVIDYGVGIPKEDLPHVFDRFYRVDKARQRSAGGVGIGLSIAHTLVEKMEGQISIQSELEKGTIITLAFKAQS